MLRELLARLEHHAALVQAASALVSVVVTTVLVGVTWWYAAIAKKTLDAMRQERSDRIAAARAPVSNALTIVEETLDEAERTLRGQSGVAEIYQVRNVLGDKMNRLSQAGSTIVHFASRGRLRKRPRRFRKLRLRYLATLEHTGPSYYRTK